MLWSHIEPGSVRLLDPSVIGIPLRMLVAHVALRVVCYVWMLVMLLVIGRSVVLSTGVRLRLVAMLLLSWIVVGRLPGRVSSGVCPSCAGKRLEDAVAVADAWESSSVFFLRQREAGAFFSFGIGLDAGLPGVLSGISDSNSESVFSSWISDSLDSGFFSAVAFLKASLKRLAISRLVLSASSSSISMTGPRLERFGLRELSRAGTGRGRSLLKNTTNLIKFCGFPAKDSRYSWYSWVFQFAPLLSFWILLL